MIYIIPILWALAAFVILAFVAFAALVMTRWTYIPILRISLGMFLLCMLVYLQRESFAPALMVRAMVAAIFLGLALWVGAILAEKARRLHPGPDPRRYPRDRE